MDLIYRVPDEHMSSIQRFRIQDYLEMKMGQAPEVSEKVFWNRVLLMESDYEICSGPNNLSPIFPRNIHVKQRFLDNFQ